PAFTTCNFRHVNIAHHLSVTKEVSYLYTLGSDEPTN
ncbi:MAG: hypothetical protein QOG23_4489, partial [Blastocatellia bacterium]|nr:hypothetical protein [Blastocatellia bacterium]